jgi:signal peptidase II
MARMISDGVPDRSQRLRAYIFLASVSGFVLALDQWSKYLVRTQLAVGQVWSPADWLTAYARILHWNNTGAAFGMLPTAGIVFSIVAVCVSVAIIYYFPRVPETQTAVRIALALQLAGAIGNLIDRILLGTVTDFISVASFPVSTSPMPALRSAWRCCWRRCGCRTAAPGRDPHGRQLGRDRRSLNTPGAR